MTLKDPGKTQVLGVLGSSRVPGALGFSPDAGQTTHGSGAARFPGPLGIGPSILLMDSTVVKAAPKPPKMPPPLHDRTKRVHVVTWDLGNSPPHPTEVLQGGLANCPVASILAAMANTPAGADRISKKVKELPGDVVTDLSDVMKELDDAKDDEGQYEWKDRPNGSLLSKRSFTVDLPGIKQQVSDVFYTDQFDQNWDLIYMGVQGIRRDKGIKPVLWPSVIEKAYALQLGGYDKLDAVNNPEVAWRALVGPSYTSKQVENLKDQDITMRVQTARQTPTIAATRDDRNDKTSVETESKGKLEGWHGYAVLGLDGGQITLYDPHGKSFPVSLAEFKKFFTTIAYGAI